MIDISTLQIYDGLWKYYRMLRLLYESRAFRIVDRVGLENMRSVKRKSKMFNRLKRIRRLNGKVAIEVN